MRSIARPLKDQGCAGKIHDQPATSPGMQGLDDDRLAGRHRDLDPDCAVADREEGVGGLPLPEQVLALIGDDVRAATGQKLQVLGVQPLEERDLGQQVGDRLQAASSSPPSTGAPAPSVARIAAASSVMSIATGHQAMQRPQPTQPEVPNWSIQLASLCVIHCR